MTYSIIEEPSFQDAVLRLGGAHRVDTATEILVEPLRRKPFEFPAVELGPNRFRYAVTKQIENIPPLVVIFTIDESQRVVHLQHVEKADFPYGEA